MMGWAPAIEAARDQNGIAHARIVWPGDSEDVWVCALFKSQIDDVLGVRTRSWAFPVTCLWCLVRLAQVRA